MELIKTENDCGLQLLSEASEAIAKLDEISEAGRNAMASTKSGLARSVVIANCTAKMGALLTPEVLQPIMYLQGREFGFKTDKDTEGGYPLDKVRECFICAAFLGLEPVGNQFNIIGGKTYIASNGRDVTLKKMGIKHFESVGIPEYHSEKTITTKNGSRTVVTYKTEVTITWEKDNDKQTEVIPFLITANNGMGYDAIIGKAESKAKKYLFKKIVGMDIMSVDDIGEQEAKDITPVISKQKQIIENKETVDISNTVNDNLPKCDKLKKELENLHVTDVTAEDIVEWYKSQNFSFNEDYVTSNCIKAVNAFRDWKRNKGEQK